MPKGVHDESLDKIRSHDETTTFHRWFGASTVVNSKGFPKIVFHGTYLDIAVFRPKKRSGALGFHFGSIAQAEIFAGYQEHCSRPPYGCIMPVYLRIVHPIRMPDIFDRGRSGSEEVADWLFDNSVISKAKHARICNARSVRAANDYVVAGIEANGFDGVVYENEREGGTATSNEDSYIVFRLEQIKSVFNRGMFDPQNPNILL